MELAQASLGSDSSYGRASGVWVLVSRIRAATTRKRGAGGQAAGDAGTANHGKQAAHGKGEGEGGGRRTPEDGEHVMRRIVIFILLAGTFVFAQDIKMPVDLDKLASKASETTEVTLNGRTLQLAA